MPEGDLEVHHVNVGHGHASILIGPEGEVTLVDTGSTTVAGTDVDVNEHISKHVERLIVARDDVDGVSNMVLTHFDTDHACGAVDLARYHGVDTVYTPNPNSYDPAYGPQPVGEAGKPSEFAQKLIEELNDLNAVGTLQLHATIDTESRLALFSSDDVDTTVLTPAAVEKPEPPYPPGDSGLADEAKATSWNEGSLSFDIEHRLDLGTSNRIGIMGDNKSGPTGEYAHMLAPHHGSASNTDALSAADVQHLTVSGAYGHEDGEEPKRNKRARQWEHPSAEYRAEAPAGANNTWTARNGTVSVVSNGTTGEVSIYTQYGERLTPEELDHDAVDGADIPDVEPGFDPAYCDLYGGTSS